MGFKALSRWLENSYWIIKFSWHKFVNRWAEKYCFLTDNQVKTSRFPKTVFPGDFQSIPRWFTNNFPVTIIANQFEQENVFRWKSIFLALWNSASIESFNGLNLFNLFNEFFRGELTWKFLSVGRIHPKICISGKNSLGNFYYQEEPTGISVENFPIFNFPQANFPVFDFFPEKLPGIQDTVLFLWIGGKSLRKQLRKYLDLWVLTGW